MFNLTDFKWDNTITCSLSKDNFNAAINELKLLCTQQEPNKRLPHFVVPIFIYDAFMQVREDNPSLNDIQCLNIVVEKEPEGSCEPNGLICHSVCGHF